MSGMRVCRLGSVFIFIKLALLFAVLSLVLSFDLPWATTTFSSTIISAKIKFTPLKAQECFYLPTLNEQACQVDDYDSSFSCSTNGKGIVSAVSIGMGPSAVAYVLILFILCNSQMGRKRNVTIWVITMICYLISLCLYGLSAWLWIDKCYNPIQDATSSSSGYSTSLGWGFGFILIALAFTLLAAIMTLCEACLHRGESQSAGLINQFEMADAGGNNQFVIGNQPPAGQSAYVYYAKA